MEPTVRHGDLLVVDARGTPVPGSLVVVRLPNGTTAVKRLVHRGPDGWWVERDNPRMGTDSWSVGAIAHDDLTGVVLARVWPSPRRYRPNSRRAT
jgi:hypothetical protein